MPGFLLHQGATVLCLHGGLARATSPSLRVRVAGQPAVQFPDAWVIANCRHRNGAVPAPCVMAQWITAATRVMSVGRPLLLQDSQAVCTPTGTGITVVATQQRVKAR